MNICFPNHPISTSELLIQLMGTNTTIQKVDTILEDFQGIRGLSRASAIELARHPLITDSASKRLYAAFELGHRNLLPQPPMESITTPQQVYSLVRSQMIHQSEEILIIQFLNRRKRLLQQSILTSGTDAMTIVDPKQIYQKALLCRAYGIIMVHNHPSGNPNPSQQDLYITKLVAQMGNVLRIPLLDHVIVGSDCFVSLKELGIVS